MQKAHRNQPAKAGKFNSKKTGYTPKTPKSGDHQSGGDLFFELLKNYGKLRSKNVSKTDKSSIIDTIISKVNKSTDKNFLVKEKFLMLLQFSIKYGSESQRDSILELLSNNYVLMMASPKIKGFLKSLFLYGNCSRRSSLIKLLGPKLPKLFCSKSMSTVLNNTFVKNFDPKLKNEFIKYFFGNSFILYKSSHPKKNLNDFIADSQLLNSSLVDICGHISNFINRQVYHLDFVHYLLCKLITYNPVYYKSKIMSIMSMDIFPCFLKTHYGCDYLSKHILLVAGMTADEIKQHGATKNTQSIFGKTSNLNESLQSKGKLENQDDEDDIDNYQVFDLNQILLTLGVYNQENSFTDCLQFSSGLTLVWTLLCLQSRLDTTTIQNVETFVNEQLWNRLIENMSTQIGQNTFWLKLLEILPLSTNHLKQKKQFQFFSSNIEFLKLLPQTKINTDLYVSSNSFDTHLICIKDKVQSHFVKNAVHILSDTNYGFVFCEWIGQLAEEALVTIFEQIVALFDQKMDTSVTDEDMWWNMKQSVKILEIIFQKQSEQKSKIVLSEMILKNLKKKVIRSWNNTTADSADKKAASNSSGPRLFKLLTQLFPNSKKVKSILS